MGVFYVHLIQRLTARIASQITTGGRGRAVHVVHTDFSAGREASHDSAEHFSRLDPAFHSHGLDFYFPRAIP